jgi:hypothetical protein
MRYELASTPETRAISPDLRVTAVFPKPRWTEGRPSEAYVKRLFAQPKDALARSRPLQDASEPFADTELPRAGGQADGERRPAEVVLQRLDVVALRPGSVAGVQDEPALSCWLEPRIGVLERRLRGHRAILRGPSRALVKA